MPAPCNNQHPDLVGGNDACCSIDSVCNIDEGDCDSDEECAEGLICGDDNCPWGDNDDCCVKLADTSSSTICDGSNPKMWNECCTSESPCGVGEGDCDFDNQCSGDLICGNDNCAWSDDSADCCIPYAECFLDQSATDYRGTVATTAAGTECMSWSETVKADGIEGVSTTSLGESAVHVGVGDHNYCRNINAASATTAWCYTVELELDKRWGYCNIGTPSTNGNGIVRDACPIPSTTPTTTPATTPTTTPVTTPTTTTTAATTVPTTKTQTTTTTAATTTISPPTSLPDCICLGQWQFEGMIYSGCVAFPDSPALAAATSPVSASNEILAAPLSPPQPSDGDSNLPSMLGWCFVEKPGCAYSISASADLPEADAATYCDISQTTLAVPLAIKLPPDYWDSLIGSGNVEDNTNTRASFHYLLNPHELRDSLMSASNGVAANSGLDHVQVLRADILSVSVPNSGRGRHARNDNTQIKCQLVFDLGVEAESATQFQAQLQLAVADDSLSVTMSSVEDARNISLMVVSIGNVETVPLGTPLGRKISSIDTDALKDFLAIVRESTNAESSLSIENGAGANPDSNNAVYIGIGVAVLLLVVIVGLLYSISKKHARVANNAAFNFEEELKKMISRGELQRTQSAFFNANSSVDDSSGEFAAAEVMINEMCIEEIPRNSVQMGRRIGGGNFGDVHIGTLTKKKTSMAPVVDYAHAGDNPGARHSGSRSSLNLVSLLSKSKTVVFDVAIKKVKDHSGSMSKGEWVVAEEELMKEATVMSLIDDHPNICGLLGVVTKGDPKLVLVSLCSRGSLLDVLKEQRKKTADEPFTVDQRIDFACEVAAGMAHLAEKHLLIHRDLAARNVLVNSMSVCKVADFGLSRAASSNDNGNSEYYRSASGIFPVRWSAPEAMAAMKFTVASDVWSYGVTVVEIFSDGAVPYGDWTLEEVMQRVCGGQRLQKPVAMPTWIYVLLLTCWDQIPSARPLFSQIGQTLLSGNAEIGQLIQTDNAAEEVYGRMSVAMLSPMDTLEKMHWSAGAADDPEPVSGDHPNNMQFPKGATAAAKAGTGRMTLKGKQRNNKVGPAPPSPNLFSSARQNSTISSQYSPTRDATSPTLSSSSAKLVPTERSSSAALSTTLPSIRSASAGRLVETAGNAASMEDGLEMYVVQQPRNPATNFAAEAMYAQPDELQPPTPQGEPSRNPNVGGEEVAAQGIGTGDQGCSSSTSAQPSGKLNDDDSSSDNDDDQNGMYRVRSSGSMMGETAFNQQIYTSYSSPPMYKEPHATFEESRGGGGGGDDDDAGCGNLSSGSNDRIVSHASQESGAADSKDVIKRMRSSTTATDLMADYVLDRNVGNGEAPASVDNQTHAAVTGGTIGANAGSVDAGLEVDALASQLNSGLGSMMGNGTLARKAKNKAAHLLADVSAASIREEAMQNEAKSEHKAKVEAKLIKLRIKSAGRQGRRVATEVTEV